MYGKKPSKILDDLTVSATKISIMAGDGKIVVRGRYYKILPAIPLRNPISARTVNISASDMRDLCQFDLEVMGIRRQPPGGSVIIWREHSEIYDREFKSLVSMDSDPPDLMNLVFLDVEFDAASLLAAFTTKTTAAVPEIKARRRGRPITLDRQKTINRAAELRCLHPNLSKGSAAASIAKEFPDNPQTGKAFDTRHIERIISPLWSAEEGD